MTGMKVVATLVLLGAAAACGGSRPDDPERSADAPLAVTTVTASLANVHENLEAGGVVSAGTSAVIASRVMAPVVEVRVNAGDRVKTGQVLVVLDDQALAAPSRQAAAGLTAAERALTAARAEHAAATAEHTLATAWHGRMSALHDRRAATAQERDDAEARLAGAAARVSGTQARIEQAVSQVAAARAASEAAATMHGFTTIRAPFDGLITETLTDPGNLAAPGTPLVRLESGGARQIEVQIDESRAAYARPGDRAAVLFESGEPVTGTVAEVERTIARGGRAFTVTVTLPEGSDVRSGTFARVRLAGAARRALRIPASAVRQQGQVSTVFTVADDVARLRLVQLGAEDGDLVEVLAGLEAGETVVAPPPAGLSDGRAVTTSHVGNGQ